MSYGFNRTYHQVLNNKFILSLDRFSAKHAKTNQTGISISQFIANNILPIWRRHYRNPFANELRAATAKPTYRNVSAAAPTVAKIYCQKSSLRPLWGRVSLTLKPVIDGNVCTMHTVMPYSFLECQQRFHMVE